MSTDQFPWMFSRDEFDLLEDEYTGIFKKHENDDSDSEVYLMEQEIIDEQMETEEKFEESNIEEGSSWESVSQVVLLSPKEQVQDTDTRSIKELLQERKTIDPLYANAFSWATHVFKWSGKQYYKKDIKQYHLFRVHVNVYLVPAKISFAQNEHTHDDMHVKMMAMKEYDLAIIYCNRVIASLRQYQDMSRDFTPAAMVEKGKIVLKQIEEARNRLDTSDPHQKRNGMI